MLKRITEDILLGIGSILFGIYVICSTYKKQPVESYNTAIPFKGYIGGGICIMAGIVLIGKKIFQLI